jgi:hypothetical protein
MGLERHGGIEVTLVEAIEIDLERAPHMRFVVRRVVERRAVDLDGAVVAGRVWRGRCAREAARHNGNDEGC